MPKENIVKRDIELIVKRTFWYDWGFVKLASLFFGIMLIVAFPVIMTYVAWYWWVLITVIICIPLLNTLSRQAKLKNKILDMDYQMHWARREYTYWEWGTIKWGSITLGMGLASYYTPMLKWFPWYYWGIFVLLLSLIPIDHMLNKRRKK